MIPRFYVDAALRAGSVCLLSEDSAHRPADYRRST
jgi:hypothetical protein